MKRMAQIMNKKIKLFKIYFDFLLSILLLPLGFMFDIVYDVVVALSHSVKRVRYDWYWNNRKFKSELKMIDFY